MVQWCGACDLVSVLAAAGQAMQTRVSVEMAASLLSFCPRLVVNGHHRTDGICFIDKGSMDSVTKTQANEPSRLFGGGFLITFPAYIAGRLKRCEPKLWVKSKWVKSCLINVSGPCSTWEFRDFSFGKGHGLPGSFPDSQKPEKLQKKPTCS